MIYLQEGNFPLNEAFSSEIVQEANSTYQLTFKFPTSDPKWALLTPETELVADDLHGEQYFTVFEVEKQHGYVTVYANQVATLLNGYSINKINVDRVNGATVMNALVAGFKRETPFTFFSDVMSKHTLNLKDISAMEALAKDKHSIVGQWGGDLVRDKYSVRLLENGGIENESLFAYKKNMKSFQETKSTKELRTRIHFKKVIEAHEEGKKDQILTVTIDSPLINKYKHIYEADMEVQDQDVVDQKTLEEYGKRYFRETLCDMIEESLEIDVVGQADQPVHMFDIVSIFHEGYNVDLRKKITKYKFNPMSIKLVSIGFGEVARTLADSISGMVNDSVDKNMKSFDAEYEAKVQKLVDNANAEYDKQAKELELKITDGIEQAKAQAEVVKQEISSSIDQKITEANTTNKNEIKEEFNAKYGDITVEMDQIKSTAESLKTNGEEIKGIIENLNIDFSTQLFNMQGEQARYKIETDKSIADLIKVSDGKADRSYVEQTAKGLKEQFTTNIGLRNYVLGTGKLANAGNDTKIYTFSKSSHGWGTDQKLRLSFDYQAEDTVKKFRINRVVRYKNGKSQWDFAINNLTTGKAFIDVSNKKSGKYSEPFTWKGYTKGNPEDIESIGFQLNLDEGSGNVQIKNLIVSVGNNETDWVPAPEDQEYIVTQAQASFERTAQGLTQKVTALETSADGLASKIAEYKQTADGQFTTITSQLGNMLKKTDINITDGRISFGTGKSIDGRTISSLLVQEPEAIALIAKLIKVNGDMVVDGSILGRHIASESVETGHMKAGSVTTPILASNSVTADKVLVDSAMIDKLVSNQAFIKELMAQKAFITQLASIDFSAEHIKGGRLSANNGSTVFDLDDGTLNLYSNTGTIRRIDETSSSQFLKMTRSGFIAEHFRDPNAAMIVLGTNHDKTENTGNGTFAGTRLWSGSGNGINESFYEIVTDRLAIYSNGKYRSPWLFHNNTDDGNSYLIPMNEKGVKHNLGRGDKHLARGYIDSLYIGKDSRDVGIYLWDLLTCFGIMKRYNAISGVAGNHVQSVLDKYGFR